jgi:hypothetical protein
MILLSVVFIKFIPNMLNAGNKIGTIKNAFSVVLKLRFGREKISSLFILYPLIANTINTILNGINNGTVANGVSYPRLSDKLFINNPKSIRKEILSPTDNTNFSVDPILFNFSICKINSPGTMVRKINPRICLKNGIFRNIRRFVKISIAIIITNHSLAPNFNTILTS